MSEAEGRTSAVRMSEKETLFVLATFYDSLDAALVDYEAVKAVYHDAGIGHDFDASVIARDGDGGTHVIMKHEESTRHGLKWGLAVGALTAVFPAIGLVGGAAVGSAIGAAAGHIKGGIPDSHLKQLGEALERGHAGLVVVYTAKMKEGIVAALDDSEDTGERVYLALDMDRGEFDRQSGADPAPAV
jgi:uncharacterized membrane protein